MAITEQHGPRTLAEWKAEEKRLFDELVKAAENGAINKFNIPFTVPRIPKSASEHEQKKFYANVCFQYKMALGLLV